MQWLKACHCHGTAADLASQITLKQKARQRNCRCLRAISLLSLSFVGIGAILGLIIGILELPDLPSAWERCWSVVYPTLIGLAAGGVSALLLSTATSGIYHSWWEELSYLDLEIEELNARRTQALEEADQHITRGKGNELTYAREHGIKVNPTA